VSEKEKIAHLEAENTGLKARLDELAAQNQLLLKQLYGKSSERYTGQPVDPKQLAIELGDDQVVDVTPEPEAPKKPAVKKPGKAKRLRLPKDMESKTVVIDPDGIDPEQCTKISEQTTEVLSIQRAKFFKTVYRLNIYKDTKGNIIRPDYPSELPLKGCNADASVLTYAISTKYVDHTPLYRQLSILRRQGVTIAESTYNDWVKHTFKKLEPLYRMLMARLHGADYLMADETTMPMVLNGKGRTKTCYEWYYYAPGLGIVAVDFQLGRSQKNAASFFKHFQGKYVQCDGYQVYDHLEKQQTDNRKIRLLGCWAHVRRKFFEAVDHDKQRAEYAVRLIKLLYYIERWADEKGMDNRQRKALRQRRAKALLDRLYSWAIEQYKTLPDQGPISKALAYMLNQWERLTRYLEDGKLEIDNNKIENKIRPLVIGRKNYLFVGSEKGGNWGAMFYSFFATCKVNGINPEQWMEQTLKKINSTPHSELEKLLPIKESYPSH